MPRSATGTPRKDRIGGCPGGKPTERGSSERLCRRSGLASRMRTPRIPRPVGRSPIVACVSGSMPVVRKRSSREPAGSRTPSAAYFAPVRDNAVSTSFWRTASSDSSELSAMPASISARILSWAPVATIVSEVGTKISRSQGSRAELRARRDELADDSEHELRLVAQRAEELVALEQGAPARCSVHGQIALGVATLVQERVCSLDRVGWHKPKLTEEIALRRDRDVGGPAVTADVESTDDRHRNARELAGDEMRRRRDLVRDRDDGVLQLVTDRVALARKVLERQDAGGADGDVDRALPPRPPERIGDDHADLVARPFAQLLADARRSSVRIQRKQDECSRLRSIGCVDACRRADEPVTRLADDERRADADDALRLAQDDLDPA